MKRLFFVLFFSLISPTLWANNIGRSQMMNVINTLPLFSKGIDLLDPKKFQSDTITLSQYGSSDNFTFPINVSYPEGEELKAFYQILEDSEKSVQNQFQGSLPKISRKMNPMTEIKKAPNIKWPFKQLFVFIAEILDKDKDKYPLLAEIFLHHKFLPYHLYVQSWPALNFLIEKQSLTLSKLYSGKNIIEWAFFLNREKMLDHLIKKYPQILEPNKLKSFLEKMLKQNQSEIVQWLLNQGVSITESKFNETLHQLILKGKTDMATVLLKHRPESLHQIPITTIMYQLLQKNKLEVAKWLHYIETIDLRRQYFSLDNPIFKEEDTTREFLLAFNQELSIRKIDTKKLINQAIRKNKLEVATWIYYLDPSALETSSARNLIIQALNARNFEIADWIYKQKGHSAFPIATAREIILSALNKNDFEKATWIYKKKHTVLKKIDTNELIIQALEKNDFEKVAWLERHTFVRLQQINISHLIRRMLILNNLPALDWIANKISMMNSNVNWEGILYQDHLSLVNFSKRRIPKLSNSERVNREKELLSQMLEAKSFQAINWLEERSSVSIQKEHLIETLKQANLFASEWILNRNPEWMEQIDREELLQISLDNKNFSLAVWLINQGLQVEGEHLDRLINHGNLKTADWLIEKYPRLWENFDKQKHFDKLITRGDIQIAEWLWNKGGLIVTEEHFDRAEDHPDMEVWIFDKIGEKIPTPEKLLSQQMIEAVAQEDLTTIIKLEKKGADLNEIYADYTPLTKAIETRNHTLISYFIKHAKVDINTLIPSTKMTAFAWALKTKNWSVATRLLKKGADPRIQNPHLSPALVLVEQIENSSTKQNLIRMIRRNLCRNGFSN